MHGIVVISTQCVTQWKKLNDKCFICKAIIIQIKDHLGEIEDFHFIPPKKEDKEMYECVDHFYVINELKNIKFVLRQTEEENFLKKSGKGTKDEWKLICEIKECIGQWDEELRMFVSIDSVAALKKLSTINEAIQCIRKHKPIDSYHFVVEENEPDDDEIEECDY